MKGSEDSSWLVFPHPGRNVSAVIRAHNGVETVALVSWNASASLSIGLYRVRPRAELMVNDLVIAMQLGRSRHLWPMVKRGLIP
jgi:type IV secretory pathway protease TraF